MRTTLGRFLLRVTMIGGFMFLFDSIAYRTGFLTDPVRLFLITFIPVGLFLISPLLSRMNLASKLEKNMWAYLSTLWLLQDAGRSVGDSLRSVAQISEDEEVCKFFNRAADRLFAAGTIEGLEFNTRITPSEAWKNVFMRIRDYYFTRGEAIGEMLRRETEETIEKTMISLKKTVELLMMVLIIYVLTATVFPFVSIMMFTFQTLVSGFGGGGISNLVLLTSVLPTPFFLILFRILIPKYFSFSKRDVLRSWGVFAAVAVAAFVSSNYLYRIIPTSLQADPLTGQFMRFLAHPSLWGKLAIAIGCGALAGTLSIVKIERKLYRIAFDFPSFLEDLFTELRTGKSFSSAILDMKASYRSLRDMVLRIKYWAKLKLPYSDILENIALSLRQSISRLSALLIIVALRSGVDIQDAFKTISDFMMRTKEVWYELEGDKKGNYITAMLSYMFVIVSMVVLVTFLNLPVPSQAVADTLKEGLMMQCLLTSILLALTLGTVRTGYLTSALRELTLFSFIALVAMSIIAGWNPPIHVMGGGPLHP